MSTKYLFALTKAARRYQLAAELPAALRAYRARHGLNQPQLAKVLDTSPPIICAMEAGQIRSWTKAEAAWQLCGPAVGHYGEGFPDAVTDLAERLWPARAAA